MSRCAANGNNSEQERCDFFDRSEHSPRCMYFIMEEYCDCWQAYEFFKINGIVTWAMWNERMDQKQLEPPRVEEEEINLTDLAQKLFPTRSCSNCTNYPGCPVDPAQYPEGIKQQLAVKCRSYIRK